MHRKRVLKKDLFIGNIIPIFLIWKTQQQFRGNAVLLERKEEKEDLDENREYELERIRFKKNTYIIINSYQKWIIRFIDGKDKGFKTQVNISHYLRKELEEDDDD